MMQSIGVALYGNNGHQVHGELPGQPRARLVATAAFDPKLLSPSSRAASDLRHYDTLQGLLDDPKVELVCLCAPRRADQAADAIRCLQAGKHVYAEKPCAMTEGELDGLIATAERTGRQFHEMAGTAFEQPYVAIREVIQAGTVGTVVQVLAQKSYPYHDGRPQDEDVDGGLILQNGVHALRMIEQVALTPIAGIAAVQTKLGNPLAGDLQMAASLMMRLANGGVACAVVNYLNHRGFGQWGNETLRIFGTKGMVEATDGGTRTRLVVGSEDRGPLDTSSAVPTYLSRLLEALCGGEPMPLSIADELSPTRWVIRARETEGDDGRAHAFGRRR